MVERHTIETYGPQPNNRNIWSSRLADSFVCPSRPLYTTTSMVFSQLIPAAVTLVLEAEDRLFHATITNPNCFLCKHFLEIKEKSLKRLIVDKNKTLFKLK